MPIHVGSKHVIFMGKIGWDDEASSFTNFGYCARSFVIRNTQRPNLLIPFSLGGGLCGCKGDVNRPSLRRVTRKI